MINFKTLIILLTILIFGGIYNFITVQIDSNTGKVSKNSIIKMLIWILICATLYFATYF